MFNRDFFPTGDATREDMLGGIDWHGKKVWEPEAGKGDLVNDLMARGAQVIACEIDPQLRKLISCQLIGEDMLQVTSDQVSHVDYIVMNPPFSAGDRHILHAWNIAFRVLGR